MRTLFTCSLLFCCILIFGQTKISGRITARNKGVKGVNVILKNTYDGATTDENGYYSFETLEKGKQVLIFSHPKYNAVEKPINIGEKALIINAKLKEKITEIAAVTITAGSIKASDKNRATALLSPIDIYTTAGSNAEITKALTYLPGVQKVGGSEGLFIRGGSGAETKIFMDGSLINNYFTSSVPGIAGRDRFNTSLFKGNVFSSGGYSALYGQALSGILSLESVDLPETTSYDFAVSPLFIAGGYQKVNAAKTNSFGGQLAYSNLGLMRKILDFNTDFTKVPESFSTNFNFRFKTKSGGLFKYYGSIDHNAMAVQNPSAEPGFKSLNFGARGTNTFHNISYRQRIGKYTLKVGSSYTFNKNDLNIDHLKNNGSFIHNFINTKGNYLNLKTVLERKIGIISRIRGGFEINTSYEKTASSFFETTKYRDFLTSVFAETDLGFSNRFSARLGIRSEHSSYLKNWNLAPRLALAYRLGKNWTTSLAYGLYYQNPESKYANSLVDLTFQKAEHFIFQVQRTANNRSLRFEAFYKKYSDLQKTRGNQYYQTAIGNGGKGYAKGFELFWRDKKSFKNIDYWISYSYLDTKRNFLNYPTMLVPSFAAEHTLSVVAKKFVPSWKTQFNLSYTFTSGRPYYDIVNQNGRDVIRNSGRLKDYSSLNFSINFLPSIGKKEAKAFSVWVLSISNILGNNNVYGYNFSPSGGRTAIVPPVKTFIFLGFFISFGIDKTQEAINNNL